MDKQLSVSAIENGVVIDHIPAGQAVRLVKLLKLAQHQGQITIGLNLVSSDFGLKDIIKIENHNLSIDEQHEVALLAPKATLNFIKNFSVVKKEKVTPPKQIKGLLKCANPRCVSNLNRMQTVFNVCYNQQKINLVCHYCEKAFTREAMVDRLSEVL